MHGRKCLALALFATSLAGCSPNVLLQPDCHSCTVEEQEWQSFSWNGLLGKWKGSVESMKNYQGSKKTKIDKTAEFKFLKAETFLQAFGGSCQSLTPDAMIINGQLWDDGSNAKVYEAFVPVDGDKVAYGRVNIDKVDGKNLCHFHRLGRVMGKNRLNLPTVSFSDPSATGAGHMPASTNSEQNVSVEFLRFAPLEAAIKTFQPDGRRPAALQEQERPSLILRIFKVSTKTGGDRGEWTGTEEYIYRLWKTE